MTPARKAFLEKAISDLRDSETIFNLKAQVEEGLYQEILKANLAVDEEQGAAFAEQARDQAAKRAALVVDGVVRNQLHVILEHIEIPLDVDGQNIGEIIFDLAEPYVGLDKTQAKKMRELQRYYEKKASGDLQKVREQLLRANERYQGERIGKILGEETFNAQQGGAYATAADLGFTYKRSRHKNDALVCPICIENAAVGWVRIDGTYPSGAEHTPFHPRCRCNELYGTDEDVKAEKGTAPVPPKPKPSQEPKKEVKPEQKREQKSKKEDTRTADQIRQDTAALKEKTEALKRRAEEARLQRETIERMEQKIKEVERQTEKIDRANDRNYR